MSTVPIKIMVAAFADENSAKLALKLIEEARKQGEIDFEDAAIIKKDNDGNLHIHETTDITTGTGAEIGGVIGGVLGLIGGPMGVIILGAAGAVIGGLVAHGDAGFQDESLKRLGEDLEPGSAVIVVVISDAWISDMEQRLGKFKSEVTVHELSEDMVDRMREGKGFSYIPDDAE
jgi:uncharacterized membrane protein